MHCVRLVSLAKQRHAHARHKSGIAPYAGTDVYRRCTRSNRGDREETLECPIHASPNSERRSSRAVISWMGRGKARSFFTRFSETHHRSAQTALMGFVNKTREE